MSNQQITVLHSSDYGCEIAEVEVAAYELQVVEAVQAAYPGAAVEVRATLGRTRASADGFDGRALVEEECTRIAQDVWEAGAFWGDP